jgi:PAS domain S-box-containing protein
MKRLAGLAAPFAKGLSQKIILLLFLFGVVPLVILATVFLVFYVERELIHIQDIQKEIVERISSDISSHVENRLNDLRLFANISNLQSVDKEKMDMLTSSLLDMEKEIDVITIADLKGNVISKISRYYSFASSELGSIIKDESFLAARDGKIHISQIEFSKFTNLPQLYMTLPIRNIATNKVTGGLQVVVNVGRMWELVSSYRIGEERYAYIVDHDGYLIIHKDIATVLRKKDLKHIQIVKDLIKDKTGIFSYSGLNGDRVIGASASIPSLRWGVIVEEPVRSAYKGLYVFSLLVILALLLTVSLAIAIGMRFSFRFIINPIKRLQEGAEAIAGGEFDKKIATEGTDELGQLAHSFNVMTENLKTTTVSRDRLAEEIEERKKVEDALRETEERYRDLASSADAMYLVDRECRYQFMNDAHLLRLGLSLDEVKGRSYGDFHSEEDMKQFAATIEAVFETGKSFQTEQYGQIDDSFFLRTFSPVKNSQGSTAAVTVISKDITERKRAEEALNETNETLSAIIRSSPIAIISLDPEGNVTRWNPAAEKMFGWPESEVLGQFLPYIPEDKRDEHLKLRERVLQGEGFTDVEARRRKKDGTPIDISVSTAPLHDSQGRVYGIMSVNVDITERKRAEMELRKAYEQLRAAEEQMQAQYNNLVESERSLRESEEKYRNILENIDDIYFEVDLKGNMTFFNDLACSISGYSKSELMGMNYRQYTSPDTASRLRSSFLNIYKAGESWSLSDFEMIKKDRGTRDMELSVNLMRNSEGEAIGFRCIARDITERKRADGERRLLQERLQRAEKMEALGTLAGGVAHDLNNVLGVLVGYSELLLQNVPKDSPFERHAMQIFKGGQRAAAIIQDLLTLTRRGVVVSEALNLNRVISDFLQMPEFEAIRSHHPGVQFKTSLDAELLNMKGSSTHLSKTVMNLLSNAAESISGSGEVLIRTENRYVDRPIHGYDTTKEGEYAVLTVSDTGSGISSSDLGRIFEPFYTKKVMGRSGTGLGLAVVWGTVRDHDGYIDVQSTEGEVSIFTLYFPVTREDLTKAEQVVPQSTYMGRGEHILVVDDVEGQRLLASAMLEGLGYKVSSVASGEEAIEFVKKQPVDLLILDMIMDPGMDGLDTYRSILDIHPQQKAIIVSGFSETDRVHTARSLGAGAYVRKPYIIEKLGLAVKNELDRK